MMLSFLVDSEFVGFIRLVGVVSLVVIAAHGFFHHH